MADIALRDYISEIESLIEGNSYDEAISHCRHILGAYPKYLEAYRLLGKAALEKEDDRAAIDLFQRVLSVDPEDFVARVGLSIVYDRQGALDDSLWQMERGFELMPSNDVIQSELRRLYGRRDGVEPERIALTRGALARMYAKGDLYEEAIAELRALLKESPDRVDLQVLLTETLWRDDQRNEAAGVAERVLDRLPHSLSANLILGEIWLNTGFSEDGEMLLRRAQALDPDNVKANDLLGPASPLSGQTTTIDRLDYEPRFAPSAEPAADQVPEWLAGLAGLSIDQPESAGAPGLPAPASGPPIEMGPSAESEIPDWMQGVDQTATESTTEADQEIPEWMTSFEQEAPAAVDEARAADAIEPAEISAESEPLPDWLTQPDIEPGMAEPRSVGAGEVEAVPDWLSEAPVSPGIPAPSDEATATDWLSEVEAPSVEEEAEPAELPGWLSDLEAEPAQPSADLEQAEVPDWLRALRPPRPEPPAPEIELPEVEESEIPDWMVEDREQPPTDEALDFVKRLGETAELEPLEAESPAQVAKEPLAEVDEGLMPSADDALSFLEGLTAGKEDELRAQAEQEAESRMSEIMGHAVSEPEPPAPEPQVAADVPVQPSVLESDVMPSADDALAFLQGLTAGKEDELRAEAERAADERMDEIMGGKPGTSPLRPQPAEEAEAPEPAAPEPTAEEMPSPEDALAFLQGLAAGKEDELRAEAERAADERMDEIMGGKPGTSPLRPQPAEEAEALEPARAEIPPAEPVEELSEAALAVTADEELLPAEDALAFLEDLTAPEPALADDLPDVIYAPAAEQGTRPLEMPAGEVVTEEAIEAPVADIGFWLQTAEDEGGEPIPEDYFERAARPQPVAPAVPVTEAEAAPPLPPIGAEEFQARLEVDPSDDEARLGLARVWWASGDRTQSLEIYQQLIEDDLFLEEVVGDLRRDVEAFDNTSWYRALGDAHMKLGNLAQALDAYRQALTRL